MRLARTFVPDLLEELFNRCVSRFIFHDDQNLRRGIARGRQNRLSWGVPIGRGKSRPLRWKLSKLPPFGCRSENGRGIAPRRDPSRATHLEAFRELWSNRPDEILGRRARMHHAGLHLSRVSGSASDSPPPLPVDSQPAKEPPGRSLLGSLRGGTKPAPLGSASRKGCGGKQRESTAPSISRAPWVLECRARRRRRGGVRLGGRAEASHAFTADGSERAEGARERVRVRVEKRMTFRRARAHAAKRARGRRDRSGGGRG